MTRRRKLITLVGTLVATGILVAVLYGRRAEFAEALTSASIWVLTLATLLQVASLVTRSEGWLGCVRAAGGTVSRRVLYHASSVAYLGSLVHAQLGLAARIAALRKAAPEDAPPVSALVAAEMSIFAVQAMLVALFSFTLVAPLGLPWWLPIACLVVAGTLSGGLRHLALRKGRELWSGLAVLRSSRHGARLLVFILLSVVCEILRNWFLLHAVGVDASLLDSIAVLIAMVTLGMLPIGPSVGAAAAVLILGSQGVAAVAAAGVLTTATGTLGGFIFMLWAIGDRLVATRRAARQAEVAAVAGSAGVSGVAPRA